MTGGSDQYFVDTNILVYVVDVSEGERHERAREVVYDLWNNGQGCVSIQVLQEFFVTVTRRKPHPMPPDEAARFVRFLSRWSVHVPDADDVLDAIRIHRRYGISFWDAMVITSAAKMGCRTVYSEDLNAGQWYGSVRVANPLV